MLFTWPGGLLIELIALHPAWHWRRSALHATRPSLNTQTAAYYLYFNPRWRNFRRIWGRIFSRSGEIFSGFGAEFSADLAKISAGPGRFSSPLACVVAAYVVEFSPLLSFFFAAYVRVSPVFPVDWGPLASSRATQRRRPSHRARSRPRSASCSRESSRSTPCRRAPRPSPSSPRRPKSRAAELSRRRKAASSLQPNLLVFSNTTRRTRVCSVFAVKFDEASVREKRRAEE